MHSQPYSSIATLAQANAAGVGAVRPASFCERMFGEMLEDVEASSIRRAEEQCLRCRAVGVAARRTEVSDLRALGEFECLQEEVEAVIF